MKRKTVDQRVGVEVHSGLEKRVREPICRRIDEDGKRTEGRSGSDNGTRRRTGSPAQGLLMAMVVVIVAGSARGGHQDPVLGGHPAWSPDGNVVAYEAPSEAGSSLRLVDLESGELTELGNGVSGNHPAWAPDGSRLVFSSERARRRDLYLFGLDTGRESRLTNTPESEMTPAWGPSGKMIAFSADTGDGMAIHVLDVTTRQRRRLTPIGGPAPATRPSWAPDGERIAFHAGRGADREIFSMRVDGTGLTRLTRNEAADTVPSWSPDGGLIAFSSRRDGGARELYVMRADGSRPRRLTDNDADDADPTWGPDSRSLIFYSNRRGPYELYRMLLDGSAEQRPLLADLPARSETGILAACERQGNGLLTRRGLPIPGAALDRRIVRRTPCRWTIDA